MPIFDWFLADNALVPHAGVTMDGEPYLFIKPSDTCSLDHCAKAAETVARIFNEAWEEVE